MIVIREGIIRWGEFRKRNFVKGKKNIKVLSEKVLRVRIYYFWGWGMECGRREIKRVDENELMF